MDFSEITRECHFFRTACQATQARNRHVRQLESPCMTVTLAADSDTIDGGSRLTFPLVVDLDGTFLKVDTIYELFAAALFDKPLLTIISLLELRNGIAAFKRRLSAISPLNVGE